MYDAALGRFHVVDAFAEKYHDFTPYQYAANNPILNIDVNGDSVRASSEEQIKRLISDIKQLYNDTNVGYEKRTVTKDKTFFGFKYGEETEEYYVVTINQTEESENTEDGSNENGFDWGQDKYASALYDAIASDEVTFNVNYSKKIPFGNTLVDGQEYGGGRNFPWPSGRGSNVFIDPRGDLRTGTPSSILMMHELIGHNHPVATPSGPRDNNAHDINKFYLNKLGIRPKSGYRTPHKGYKGEVKWNKTNLY